MMNYNDFLDSNYSEDACDDALPEYSFDTTAFSIFLQDIKHTAQLTWDEEQELSRTLVECSCFSDHDLTKKCSECTESIHTIVLHNIPIVIKLSKLYPKSAISRDDLTGYGILGLFIAASRFDYRKNVAFIYYGVYWIRYMIDQALRNCSGTPVLPYGKIRKIKKIMKVLSEMDKTEISLANMKVLSEKSGISPDDIEKLQLYMYKVVSLEESPAIADESPSILDTIVVQERQDLVCKELYRILTPLQYAVVSRYCGLLDGSSYTFKSIAESLGQTVECTRLQYAAAIERLKESNLLRLLYNEMD